MPELFFLSLLRCCGSKGITMKKNLIAVSAAFALLISGCASHDMAPTQSEMKKVKKEHVEHASHWDYSKNGPTHWQEFSETCGVGHAQSPINILPGKTVALDPQFSLNLDEDIHTSASVIDNGHSIKVTPKPGASITLHGQRFNLLQFHFHGKSEHTVDGKRYDMVAHFVHQNPITQQLAVVAVFFEEGEAKPILDTIIEGVGTEVDLDPQELLPADTQHYFHYVGSLTTPPCSENVQWYLLKQPSTASKAQINAFRKYYVDNERPVQELYDRQIESN